MVGKLHKIVTNMQHSQQVFSEKKPRKKQRALVKLQVQLEAGNLIGLATVSGVRRSYSCTVSILL